MKQKDIALIIVVAFISAMLSFFLSNQIIVTKANRQQQVEVVDAINGSFQTPSDKYFNKSSIDPTQLVQIGANNNNNPFNSRQ